MSIYWIVYEEMHVIQGIHVQSQNDSEPLQSISATNVRFHFFLVSKKLFFWKYFLSHPNVDHTVSNCCNHRNSNRNQNEVGFGGAKNSQISFSETQDWIWYQDLNSKSHHLLVSLILFRLGSVWERKLVGCLSQLVILDYKTGRRPRA